MNTTPKKINNHIKILIDDLGLNEDSVTMMKLRKQTAFETVEKYCIINCIKKKELAGGSIQFGWIIWQDKAANFTEAEFHAVWADDQGKLHDITHRIDKEKRIMFVPDPNRSKVIFKDNKGIGSRSYTNHKMHNGVIVEPTRQWKVYMEPEVLARIGAKL